MRGRNKEEERKLQSRAVDRSEQGKALIWQIKEHEKCFE
jgi:hypothetical protein